MKTHLWVALALVLSVACSRSPAPTAPTKAQPWEYNVIVIPDDQFTRIMDAAGRDGWELATARRVVVDGADARYEVVFKRPILEGNTNASMERLNQAMAAEKSASTGQPTSAQLAQEAARQAEQESERRSAEQR